MNMDFEISRFFSKDEKKRIDKEAGRAEKSGQLTEPMLALIKENKLFHLFVPQVYGGLQCPLPEALPWLEAASWLDGSLGWTLTLGAGAGLFGAYMKPDFAKSVFTDNNVLIAGSGFPGGIAEIQKDGYQINGQWKYASGIEHASLVTATCYLARNGQVQHEEGEPKMKAVAFHPSEISWKRKWKSYGLKATGSYNFKAENISVPVERSFVISPGESNVEGLLYNYPFEPFAHCTLAISLIGMAGRFLNEAENILLRKNDVDHISELSNSVQTQLTKAKNEFRGARKSLYSEVENSWNKLDKENELSEGLANQISQQSRESCRQTLKSTEHIYPFLGMSVINPDSLANRCWRDLHTASQHMLLTPDFSSK